MSQKWKILGYDTFEGEYYPLIEDPEFNSEEEARQKASEHFLEIEKTQPSNQSGGQSEEGIQDRLFIVRPDGTKYRFIP